MNTIEKYELLSTEQSALKQKKKVAAYCRVSTDSEDQANSFESQKSFFTHYIETQPGWELYRIFADEGKSGTSTKKRNDFNKMIELAKDGEFNLIITKEISRFARNTLDSILYTRLLKKHGVGVIFLNDGINTLDKDAELRLTILASIAQEESRKTSDRVKWGQKRRMEAGVVFGRSMLGYDVKDGKMTVNEEGAKIVRLIFHKFVDEGKGTHVIARELREEGIRSMTAKEWSNTVILRLIRNEKYCGDLIQKKTFTPDYLTHEKKYNHGEEDFVIIRDHHTPIISREVFEKAQRILDERAVSPEGKAKHSNRYTFSGKIKCGKCGLSFVAHNRKRTNGNTYKSWRCAEAAKNGSPHTDKAGNSVGCSNCSIRNDEALHIMYLVARFIKYDRDKVKSELMNAIRVVLSQKSSFSEHKRLTERIAEMSEKRSRLISLFTDGSIDKEEFDREREKYESILSDLRQKLDAIESRDDLRNNKDRLMKDIEKAIDDLSNGVEYEDTFYRMILDKLVVVDKDTVDVYLYLIPDKWRFTVSDSISDKYECAVSDIPVPTSVNMPITRSYGIANR